jgi:hypothetical protein
MYPTCVRQIYKAALVELNDEELGIIRIKFDPVFIIFSQSLQGCQSISTTRANLPDIGNKIEEI